MSNASRHLQLLRDALLVAGLAVLTVQALRKWVGDRYLVPTGSMEPVLHGHPQHGDIVFVDKTARAADRRRHDLVVVVNPKEPQKQIVKRLAARGDEHEACWINLMDGDVWLGPDAQHLAREQKDPRQARSMRVPWAEAPGTAASEGAIAIGGVGPLAGAGPWRLAASDARLGDRRQQLLPGPRTARRRAAEGLLPDGCLGTTRPVDAGCIDATGVRSAVGSDVFVTDVGLDLLCGELRGELLATIETRAEALTFHWQPATGRVVLWRDGVDVDAMVLPAGPAERVEFGLLDDRAFFVLDDQPARSFVVARRPEWNERGSGKLAGVRTLAHIAVVAEPGGEGRLDLRSVRVFHDVFAWREPIVGKRGEVGTWPRFVPPGRWFLLGDSAFASSDSREFDAVSMATFLGVPRLVLGPWPRGRRVPS
ncbi:MAG: S26 family signal peptidase [Planctomycetes bacterium]|jgi:hypothetical protein|nr:S26 family signal peptidase [Planctomycetota bacterium]